MRALIIGYGSIGARHARLLAAMGLEVACLTQNTECPFPRFDSMPRALGDWKPERVVICNPTGKHAGTLAALELSGYRGPVLVEKPLFSNSQEAPEQCRLQVFVAYNLRFHPLIRQLRHELGALPLYAASFYAGQYLPQWRPQADYRASYSARQAEGGGVLRDLSHELDLAAWLCGDWLRLAARGGHFSDLEIETDDAYAIVAETARCPLLTVAINYLDRIPRRTIVINGQGLTAAVDLVAGTISINGETRQLHAQRDETYLAQQQAFVALDSSTLCTMEEGLKLTKVIAAVEAASSGKGWVTLSTN